MCRSRAVSTSEREETDELCGRLLLRCGGCGTWRSVNASFWSELMLERRLRRDRRRMARSLGELRT